MTNKKLTDNQFKTLENYMEHYNSYWKRRVDSIRSSYNINTNVWDRVGSVNYQIRNNSQGITELSLDFGRFIEGSRNSSKIKENYKGKEFSTSENEITEYIHPRIIKNERNGFYGDVTVADINRYLSEFAEDLQEQTKKELELKEGRIKGLQAILKESPFKSEEFINNYTITLYIL